MDQKKYKSVVDKIRKWAAGKADRDLEVFLLPAKKRLEEYLEDRMEVTNEIMKIVYINNDLNVNSWWNYHKYLDLQFNGSNEEDAFPYLLEAMEFRILRNVFGYTKPQNIGSVNEGQLACCICDAIFLSDPLLDKLIIGYQENMGKKPPQLNPQSVIQYAHALYFHLQNKAWDPGKFYKKPLIKQYSDLLKNINADVEIFTEVLNVACDFHLERSKNSPSFEFNLEEDMVIPSELLATLKLRKDSGVQLPATLHPLLLPYRELIFNTFKVNTSLFYKTVRKKIEHEFL